MAVGSVQHKGCLLNKQEFSAQCNLWAKASDGWQCARNPSAYLSFAKYMAQARDIIDVALATAMHAMHTTVATTLGSTPGSLACSWDMFLSV